MVVVTKFEFMTRLCEEKVLTLLTSVVLNENHLVRFVIRMVAYVIYFLRVINNSKEKEKGSQKV